MFKFKRKAYENNSVDQGERVKIKKLKKVLSASLLSLIVLMFGMTFVPNFYKSNQLNKANQEITPELARAMTYEQFQPGDENIEGTDNVKFSAFFLRDLNGDGYAEKIKGTCKEVGNSDTLYMEYNVLTEGKLKDGKIEIQGKNFYFSSVIPRDEQVKNNYIDSNIKAIELNEITNGTQKMLMGMVCSGIYTNGSRKTEAIGNNINNYSQDDNKIIFTGIYEDDEGNETSIRKEISLTVDWYGKTRASLKDTQRINNSIDNSVDYINNVLNLKIDIRPYEEQNELLLKENYVEGYVPDFCGYSPVEVKCLTQGVEFTYDKDLQTYSIRKQANINGEGIIVDSAYMVNSGGSRYNSYTIKVSYPLDAFYSIDVLDKVELLFPVSTYYEGFNNANPEFTNPYKSDIENKTIVVYYTKSSGGSARFEVRVGKRITNPSERYIVSKKKPLKIYNGVSTEEKKDYYTVDWICETGSEENPNGMIVQENQIGEEQLNDEFIKSDASFVSMEDLTANVGIAFLDVENFLKDDGYIKVYDIENDLLLCTFTKDGKEGSENWNAYTIENPYVYSTPVKHIRIETSSTKSDAIMHIYNIKELNDSKITEIFTKEEFEQLAYIKSNIAGYLDGELIRQSSNTAIYEAPYSIAKIDLSQKAISTQITEDHEKIIITVDADDYYNQEAWLNGSFLVKFPTEIISVEVNDIYIDNPNVSVVSAEYIENENGRFIKINTNNDFGFAETFELTIDTNISPDPRIATMTRPIELWAYNEEVQQYYYTGNDIYDVNSNLNLDEKVNKGSTNINLVTPNTLLVAQTASEFDDKGSNIIAPQIADIQPIYGETNNEKTAKVGINLKNNYTGTLSELKLIGVIPFEGNSYVISDNDLKSEFTTHMSETGIIVPDNLEEIVDVYYSNAEKPDRDINKAENNWKKAEEITNWDDIKTFMIDFKEYSMEVKENLIFEYTVKIPNEIDLNKVSFSEVGVYFCLDTDEGKYKTKIGPNKLGFRIAEKYDLKVEKFQKDKDKTISGATYLITKNPLGDLTGVSKTAVTYQNGTMNISDLYAEEVYSMQEIKNPQEYDLNPDVIQFTTYVDRETGELIVEKIDGETRSDLISTQDENGKIVSFQVEDEAKATLKIVKKDKDTSTPIRFARFRIKGPGFSNNGKIIATNVNGEATLKGLKINEVYELTETKAEGYYLNSSLRFKIVNDSGEYKLLYKGEDGFFPIDENGISHIFGQDVQLDGIVSATITENDSIPTLNLGIVDPKIPTYNLNVTKIKHETEVSNVR